MLEQKKEEEEKPTENLKITKIKLRFHQFFSSFVTRKNPPQCYLHKEASETVDK